MKTKPGVIADGVRPETWFCCGVAHAIHQDLFHTPLVITSLMDGTHLPTSLHYKGLAVDFRDRDLSQAEKAEFLYDLREVLVPLGYQVVQEKNHLHCEFDPGESGLTWREDLV
jgi:hypothetical protein